jgi:hypothetical protein
VANSTVHFLHLKIPLKEELSAITEIAACAALLGGWRDWALPQESDKKSFSATKMHQKHSNTDYEFAPVCFVALKTFEAKP